MKISEENPWKVNHQELRYDNRWISVTESQVTTPAGTPGLYGTVHFKNKAIGIIPVDGEGYTWLVGQWRFPLNAWSWEIPEGGCPEGQLPAEAAQRELKEETGLVAGDFQMIQRIHLSNSVSDEEGFLFLARELNQQDSAREETEADMKVWRLPFREAFAMVLDGRITDSLSVAGLLKVAHLHPHLLSKN